MKVLNVLLPRIVFTRNTITQSLKSFFKMFLESTSSKPLPTNPICKAADLLERFMKKKGYAICNGRIYKKAPESQFTFVYCSNVEDFLMRSMSNGNIADAIASYTNTLSNLLSKPSCRLIKPIRRLFNIIEVLPSGTCFMILEKRFVTLKEFPEGCTPRAFVKYEYTKNVVPYPRYFVNGK